MFGVSQQDAINQLGEPLTTEAPPLSDRSSSVADVTSSEFQNRFSSGDFGRESLIGQTLTARNDALHQAGLLDDPTVYATSPLNKDYLSGTEDQPSVYGSLMGNDLLHNTLAQRKQEDKITQIYKDHPELVPVTFNDAVNEAAGTANSLDMQNADIQNHAGVTAKVLGDVAGGGAAVFTPENRLQMESMLLPVKGGSVITRMGSMALQQFGVSLATQAGVVNPSREATGLSTRTGGEMFEQALLNGVVGGVTQGAFEGVGAGYKYYFPATSKGAAADVSAKLDDLAAGSSNVSGLAGDIKAAKTPEQAAAAMAGAPLETQLDLAHAAVENPSAPESAALITGEHELMHEKAQPDGMSWDDHMERATDVRSAIENDQRVPDGEGMASPGQLQAAAADTPKLPGELGGAKPRYGYQDKQFDLSFESDIDKALYITAQKKPSARDADYRGFLQDQGYTPSDIAKYGQELKDRIKLQAKGAPAGKLNVEASTLPNTNLPPAKVRGAEPANSPFAVLRNPPKTKEGETLLDFIARKGGVKDTGGDLKAMGANAYNRDKAGNAVPFKRKLEHAEGMSLDDMANLAHEHGYFSEHGEERPTVNDLLDRMEEGLRGNHTYPHGELDGVAEAAHIRALEEQLDKAGVGVATHTDAQILDALQTYHDNNLPEPAAEPEPFNQHDVLQAVIEDKLAAAKPGDIAPLSGEKNMTVQDALDEIKEHEGLLESLTTCFTG